MDKKEKVINDFISDEMNNNLENNNEEVVIISDKSIVEKVNKKIITENGKELIFG